MFRKNTNNLKEHYQRNFTLANSWLEQGTETSVIAAFKLLADLYKQNPLKAVQGKLRVTKLKLKNLGILDKVLEDESSQPCAKTENINHLNISSKL